MSSYLLMRQYCKFVLRFFIKKIEINGFENLSKQGPNLLACYHPNSFFDAIVINCAIPKPTFNLTRGDAFKKPLVKKILTGFQMLPIFRLSEGKSLMVQNDKTFDACYNVFKQSGQVLIFSEGLCTHQTQLLPLKKGTARLAFQAWENNLDLKVISVATNYDAYRSIGKNMTLNFGQTIKKGDFTSVDEHGKFLIDFNQKLTQNLNEVINNDFKKPTFGSSWFYYLGWLINFPLYFLIEFLVERKTKKTVFFDSVAFAYMIALLPIYWLLLFFVIRFCI